MIKFLSKWLTPKALGPNQVRINSVVYDVHESHDRCCVYILTHKGREDYRILRGFDLKKLMLFDCRSGKVLCLKGDLEREGLHYKSPQFWDH